MTHTEGFNTLQDIYAEIEKIAIQLTAIMKVVNKIFDDRPVYIPTDRSFQKTPEVKE